MSERLSVMQRRVLSAMANDDIGLAAFTGEESRKCGFGVFPAKGGGIIIRAYQGPEYFLKLRGLIEPIERNVPGHWYRLTETGRAALATPEAK